jgi:hypothetical protein
MIERSPGQGVRADDAAERRRAVTRHHLRALPLVLLLVVIVSMLTASLVPSAGQTKANPVAAESPWATALRRVDDAVRRHDISGAVMAWHDAHVLALRSRQWEGLVAVGDAYLRIGDASGIGRASQAKARQIYLAALYRARAVGSIDGVLSAAQAFESLGDGEVVQACLRIADDLATRRDDPVARARVRAFSERMVASEPGDSMGE